MAVNYVKGQILSGILERDGIDIAIANANVGINTTTPTVALDVYGNINANNLSTTGNVTSGNIVAGNIVLASAGNISAGNVNINNLAEPVANTDATTKFYVDQTVGNVTTGNLTISNTTISSSLANATITIQPTGTGLVSIDTTTGLILPVGNTAQRPSPAATGTTRFNSTTGLIEVYNGNAWNSTSQAVTNQTLNGNGTATTFTLDRSTTTAAALIMLNGITQVPGQSYDMVPDPSANLVFTEAPGTGDVIDIRFL